MKFGCDPALRLGQLQVATKPIMPGPAAPSSRPSPDSGAESSGFEVFRRSNCPTAQPPRERSVRARTDHPPTMCSAPPRSHPPIPQHPQRCARAQSRPFPSIPSDARSAEPPIPQQARSPSPIPQNHPSQASTPRVSASGKRSSPRPAVPPTRRQAGPSTARSASAGHPPPSQPPHQPPGQEESARETCGFSRIRRACGAGPAAQKIPGGALLPPQQPSRQDAQEARPEPAPLRTRLTSTR